MHVSVAKEYNQYLVCYEGYGREHDEWHPSSEMADMDALDKWEDKNGTEV